MEKHFDIWNGLKKTLDAILHRPPFVSEGDIWWVSFGENVGSETSGKSALFSRPAVILKKLSHGFYLVAPTTTKDKTGTWYVPIRHKEILTNVCLHQIRTIDYRRLSSKMGSLDDADILRIKEGFRKLYSL